VYVGTSLEAISGAADAMKIRSSVEVSGLWLARA